MKSFRCPHQGDLNICVLFCKFGSFSCSLRNAWSGQTAEGSAAGVVLSLRERLGERNEGKQIWRKGTFLFFFFCCSRDALKTGRSRAGERSKVDVSGGNWTGATLEIVISFDTSLTTRCTPVEIFFLIPKICCVREDVTPPIHRKRKPTIELWAGHKRTEDWYELKFIK